MASFLDLTLPNGTDGMSSHQPAEYFPLHLGLPMVHAPVLVWLPLLVLAPEEPGTLFQFISHSLNNSLISEQLFKLGWETLKQRT